MKSFDFNEFYNHFLIYGNVQAYFLAEDGYELGKAERKIRYNLVKLLPEQIELLNKLQFDWGRANKENLVVKTARKNTFDFEKFYNYFLKYGHRARPFIIDDGSLLGYDYPQRIRNIRLGRIKLSSQQKQLLTDAGFVWFVRDSKKRTKDGEIIKND